MAGTMQIPRSHVRTRQTPGGGDRSSPGDEGDSSPRRGNSGRDQPLDHQRSKTPRRRKAGGSPDGDPGSDGSPGDERHPPRRDPSRGGRLPGSPGGGPPGPPGDPGPQGPLEIKDPQDHKVQQDK